MGDVVIPVVMAAIFFGGITVTLTSYFKLLRHRADAQAMAEYRALAEQSADTADAVRAELSGLSARLSEVERMLRSVDS